MTQYKVEDYLNLDDSQFSDSAEEVGIYLTQGNFDESFSSPTASVPVIIAEVPKLSRLSELSLLPQYSSSSSNRVEKKSVQKHKKEKVLKTYVKAIDKTLETSDSSILSSTPSPKSIFSYEFASSLDDERAFSVTEEHLQLPQDDAYINENDSMFKMALEKSPAVSPGEAELIGAQASILAINNNQDFVAEPQVQQNDEKAALDVTSVRSQIFGDITNLERSLELAAINFEEPFEIYSREQFQVPQQQEHYDEVEDEDDEDVGEDEEDDEYEEEEGYSEEQNSGSNDSLQFQATAHQTFNRLHEIRVEMLGGPSMNSPMVPEKRRRKLSIQPLTFDQIRLTHGLLRKTMIRHYDTEDLKIQIKKEIAKEQKAIKDALKRPEKTLRPKKRTISKTRLQDVSINYHQILMGLRDLEVSFSNNHILSSGYWSAKGDAGGITEMRSIVSVLRHQYEHQITFEFIDDDLSPSSVPDGIKLLKFSVISRYCEHLENEHYVNGWVHLITYNDLSELLGFALDISDEMIVVNDDSLIFETQNEPWKRLLMRWRSIYDKKLFIISESKEMMQLKIEKAKARGKPFKLDEREKILKEDLFNQLMSYKGLLGAPSKTAKDQALIKTNKLQTLIKIVLEKYCWVDPSQVPEGGYRRLF